MKHIHIKYKMVYYLLVVICIMMSACVTVGKNGQNKISNVENVTNRYTLTKEDKKTELKSVNKQNNIDLSKVEESTLLIDTAGDYKLSGTYYGTIYISTDDDEIVHLFFDNVNVFSKYGPAIYVESANKLVITMLERTENILADSINYNGYEEQNSSIYSNTDITINGKGKLNIFGYYNDAVKSKGYVKIVDGDIEIRSKDIGIRANDGILISSGTLDIQSEGTGLYTKNSDKEGKGIIEIVSGSISIVSGKNAIYSASDVHIFGGTIAVNSVDEKIKSEGRQYIKEGCLQ